MVNVRKRLVSEQIVKPQNWQSYVTQLVDNNCRKLIVNYYTLKCAYCVAILIIISCAKIKMQSASG